MTKYTIESITILANSMRRARNDGKPFHMLTGAGCSKSAGIPLAAELVNEIHGKYLNECKQKLTQTQLQEYGACMSCLTPNERRDLLSPHLDRANINWAHIAIASLMSAGYITRVLTFNFDSVLARACGLVGLYPATYDFAASASDVTSHLASPAVIHLHGQGFAHRLLNAENETAENAENIRPLFRNTFSQHPFIVIGYSGESDSVFPTIREQYQGEERLYWAGYAETPSKSVSELIGKGGNTAEYLGNADADNFLIDLARELECFPPMLFSDPHGHLLEELKSVSTFPLQEQVGPDLLARLRSKLHKLSDEEHLHTKPDLEALMMEGKWREVIEAGNPEDEHEAQFMAWAFLMEANSLAKPALINNNKTLLELSLDKYHRAVDINPNMPEAYNNWGTALIALSNLKDGDTALLEKAINKFQKSAESNPAMHQAYNNWGTALGKLAKQKKDVALLNEAFEKYQKSVDIEPNQYEAYFNWGTDLGTLALLKNNDALLEQSLDKLQKAVDIDPGKQEAYLSWGSILADIAKKKDDETLYEQAFEKFQKVVDINPGRYEAYNRWGIALKDLATKNEDPALFRQAFDRFQKAVQIDPGKHEAYSNWGVSLVTLATLTEDHSLFEQAFDVYRESADLQPGMHDTYFGWGYALLTLARLKSDGRLTKEALDKFHKAIDINPNMHEAYLNAGAALSVLANLQGDDALFEKAFDKFQKTVDIKPNMHEAYFNWGTTLFDLAIRKEDRALLERACEKFQKTVEINPSMFTAYENWGLALKSLSQMTNDQGWLEQARVCFEQSERLCPNKVYNLACVLAITGDCNACRDKLYHCKEFKTLPGKLHLLGDEDLKNVRDLLWFQELIHELPD